MGFVCIFTGKGRGKTFSAFGMAMRFMGFGKKVVVVQFLKASRTGEAALRKQLPQLEIVQFGTDGDFDRENISEEDRINAKEALFYARRLMARAYRPDLLILDEVNTALSAGLVEESAVMEIMDKLPDKTNLVLTGEGATKRMIERADAATEMKDLKMKGNGKR